MLCICCLLPGVLVSSQALSKVLPGVTTRTKGKTCFAFVVVLLSSKALIIRAVVEPMLSHLELPLSHGQPSQALKLQYTIHWSKYIARIDTLQHEIHYTLLASIHYSMTLLASAHYSMIICLGD